MQKVLLGVVIFLLIAAGLAVFILKEEGAAIQGAQATPSSTIEVGEATVEVLVADTSADRRRGLSGRATLGPNQGMLFVFDVDDTYRIWMKDMHFSLDILWISKSGVIVDIRENIAPDTYPEVFGPRAPARYVLEVPAGFVERNEIERGDRVAF